MPSADRAADRAADFGKVLTIDLASGERSERPLTREEVHGYLGGRGLNGRMLYDLTRGGEDPLSPDNPLIFGCGLLTGSPAPCASRYTVTAKSPLTGGFGDGNSGGFFGPELRFAGYSHLVVLGRAAHPVCLYIADGAVELREAGHLWGRDTHETDAGIKEELGDPDLQIACIGPAGENLVKVACIINNLSRAVGRSGIGAVMGAKNLKAVAVRGSGRVPVARPEAAFALLDEMAELMKTDLSFQLFGEKGTPGLVDVYNSRGVFPVRNFQASWLPDVSAIGGEEFLRSYSKKSKACYNCVIHCSHYYELPGSHQEEGLEFESIGSLGPRIGITDYPPILKANHLCNRLGLDTIGTGDAVGFLMELYQRGIVESGIRWGDGEGAARLIGQIARREGIGDLLAEGSFRAARRIGKGAERYAMHVKGQAIISTDPRGLRGWGLGFAVASRGADHLRAHPVVEYCFTPERAEAIWGTAKAVDRAAYEGKGKLIRWCEDARAIADCLGVCKFLTRTAFLLPSQLARLIEPVLGVPFAEEELMRIGERVNNIERMFNVREGFDRSRDSLPERLRCEPIPEGPSAGMVIRLEEMLDEYYRSRGWDVQTGRPTPGKLRELGLEG